MSLADLTIDAVHAAIAEYDDLGGDEFLAKHEYGRGKDYFVRQKGKYYDSKAIAGVAHGYVDGLKALRSDEFTGGAASVVSRLKALGFNVTTKRSPAWTRDELILACDLVAKNNWKYLDKNSKAAADLSDLLRSLPIFPIESRPDNFRSASSVAHKTADIATAHPDYDGSPKNGGTLDKEVLSDFLENPEKMHKLADSIRESIKSDTGYEQIKTPIEDEDDGVPEGRLLQRKHYSRERDPKIRKAKIDQFLHVHDRVHCEACGFDFEKVYGDRGAGLIEVHHVRPLHESGPTTTRLSDLMLVCANCHRMIHYGNRWLTPTELRELLGKSA